MSFQARVYGKYFLLDKVATGGMAEVFKAKMFGVQGFERLLVIKQILPHLTKDSDFVEMFIDEAKIAVELSHANIVQVFDLGKVGDNYFIAMECIDGKDLRAILKKSVADEKPLPVSHAAHITAEILRGLEYAHKKCDSKSGKPLNIIHRDISPQNIMVSYEGEIKIVDFGIAKAEHRINETQAGVLKGKFGYMSPEQAMGYEVDHRSDLFSCGILLFEMLTGRRLFMGENDLETLELIREADIPPISKYNQNVPSQLEEIAYQALQRDAEDRFVDAKNMQLELTKFMFNHNQDFTSADLAIYLKTLFDREMDSERLRLQEALAAIEEKFEIGDDGRPRGQVDAPKEVSFIHPNTHSAVTTPAGGSGPRSIGTPIVSNVTTPSSPSGASYGQSDMANQKTLYQPKHSGTVEQDFIDLKPDGGSFVDSIRGMLVPILLATAILVLLWFNFFREPPKRVVEEKPPTAQNTVQRGTIDLASEPAGAEVYIGNQFYGNTPVTLEFLAGQDQTFVFRLAGYGEKSMTLFISEGSNNPLKVRLEKDASLFSSLRIQSKPSGARIYLNGEETGKRTPFTFDELRRGVEAVIRLYKRGFQPAETTVALTGESVEKTLKLKGKLATLSVDSNPPGAAIFINGRGIGNAPATASLRMNESVKVTAKLKGYVETTQKIRVKAINEKVKLTMRQAVIEYGYISVNADPWAVIYLDGELLGNTPILGARVAVGKHELEFQHSDYGKKRQTISVSKSNTKDNPLLVIKNLKE